MRGFVNNDDYIVPIEKQCFISGPNLRDVLNDSSNKLTLIYMEPVHFSN